jgi:hypothetical protein
VFISRTDGTVGESAAYGPGFYTRKGRVGGRGTGVTIRFTVNPEARQGSDFQIYDDYVIFTNKKALKVIPESIEYPPVEYFQKLAAGLEFDFNDKGQVEKFTRRIRNQLQHLSKEDFLQITNLVRQELSKSEIHVNLFYEWFKLPGSAKYPHFMLDFLSRTPDLDVDFELAKTVFPDQHWSRHPKLLLRLIRRANVEKSSILPIITDVLSKDHWLNLPEAPELISEAVLKSLQTNSSLKEQLGTEQYYAALVKIFSSRAITEHPDVLFQYIRNLILNPSWIVSYLVSTDAWKHNDQIVRELLRHPGNKSFTDRKKLELIKSREPSSAAELEYFYWETAPETDEMRSLIQEKLSAGLQTEPVLAKSLSRTGRFAELLVANESFVKQAHDFPEVLDAMISEGNFDREIATKIFAVNTELARYPTLLAKLIAAGDANREIAEHVLSKPQWAALPESILLLEQFIRAGSSLRWLNRHVLSQDIWKKSGELNLLCGGRAPTAELLREVFEARGALGIEANCSSLLR